MKISLTFCDRVLPFCGGSKHTKKRIKNYFLVKKFIKHQICLKNIVTKLNELEKLKHIAMNDEQLIFFDKIDIPHYIP
jgi:hypothetical protein